MSLEWLEQRIPLAADINVTRDGTTMYLDGVGTPFDDDMSIQSLPGGKVAIDIAGGDGSVASSTTDPVELAAIAEVDGLDWGGYRLFGGDGDDRMDASGLKTEGVELHGGGDNDTLIGGAGPDILKADGGDNDHVLNAGVEDLDATSSTVDGGEGDHDVLTFRVQGPGITTCYQNTTFHEVTGTREDDCVNSSGYTNTNGVIVKGLRGKDTLTGSDFDDELTGGKGNDTLRGRGGNDRLMGQGGEDALEGGPGDDTLRGGSESDSVSGGVGTDDVAGGAGNDTVDGGMGDGDTVRGDAGDDILLGNEGLGDKYRGGPGTDTIDFSLALRGVTLSLKDQAISDNGWGQAATVRDTENVIGATRGGNQITGDDNPNLLVGGDGSGDKLASPPVWDDILHGLGGDDTLEGLDGDDQLDGGAGADILRGGRGDDELRGGPQNDELRGGAGDDNLLGGAGSDDLSGGDGDDTLDGGPDVDVLFGDAGDDELLGGFGYVADILSGGGGSDTVDGQAGADVLFGGFSDAFPDTLVTEYDASPQSMVDTVALGGANTTFVVPGTIDIIQQIDAQVELTAPPGGNILGLPSNIVADFGDDDRFIFPVTFVISGRTFDDRDGDGTDDRGAEPGVGGVTITLAGEDEKGTPVNVRTTTTAGRYVFAGLEPGTYTLTETLPAGRINSTPTSVGPLTVNIGDDVSGVDFGSYLPVEISGRKFDDLNGDGDDEAGADPGVGGVAITLTGTEGMGGVVSIPTSTADDGTYSFQDLNPGRYTVTETVPPNSTPSTPTSIGPLTLESGDVSSGNDFGNVYDSAPGVVATTPGDNVTDVAPDTNLEIRFSENVTVTGDWVQVVGSTSGLRTISGGDLVITNANPTFTIDAVADFNGGETITVTVFADQVTDDDTIDPPNHMDSDLVFRFGTAPVAVDDSYTASGNIGIRVGVDGVLGNDEGASLRVSHVQGSAAKVGVATPTVEGGEVILNATGDFIYEPPPGFEGTDSFTYAITGPTGTSGPATVEIGITEMVWFIDNSVGASSNVGTFSHPFRSIGDFNVANRASGLMPDPKDGDLISLRTGTGTYSESDGINLRPSQILIGEAVRFDTVFTADANSLAAYDAFASGTHTAPTIEATSGIDHGVDLASDNTVRGLNVGDTAGGFAFNGSVVGEPTINAVNVTGTGGTIRVSSSGSFGTNVTFDTLESTSSPGANIALVDVTGTLGVASGGSGLSDSAAGSAAVSILGTSPATNTVSLSYPGNVSKTNDGATVEVANHGTGTLAFSGTVSATDGTGLQFRNADGPSYEFTGTTTLHGGDAGIDILGGSGGTFAFSRDTSITDPSGAAFYVDGSPSGDIIYHGTITQNHVSPAVHVHAKTGGTTTLGGAITASTSTVPAVYLLDNRGSTVTFQDALDIDTTTGIGFRAVGGGTVNVVATGGDQSINTTDGQAIFFQDVILGMTFDSVSSASSGGAGIQLDFVSGTLTMNGGSISRASGTAFDVGGVANSSGGDATVVYAGSITNSAGRSVLIQELGGGSYTLSGDIHDTGEGIRVARINNGTPATVTFSGSTKSVNTGTRDAVSLGQNSDGTINFVAGGLDIDTSSGLGFSATGGGTINVAGPDNHINTLTGTALNVKGTTIGPSGIWFESISAGTATDSTGAGIVLDDTGTQGGLTVNGGTIQHKTGSDGETSRGIGMYLNQTHDVALSNMQLNDFSNFAIRGAEVTNFQLSNTTINGTNGDNVGLFEGSVGFSNLLGSASIDGGTSISGGVSDNLKIVNTRGTLDRLIVDTITIGANGPSGHDGMYLEAAGSSTVNVTVTNSTFTGAREDLLHLNALDQSTMDWVVTDNGFSNNHSNIMATGGGTTFSGGGEGSNTTVTYEIANNTFRDARGIAVNVVSGTGGGSWGGTISQNVIGVSGVDDSGSAESTGILVMAEGTKTHSTSITHNTIRQWNLAGLELLAGAGSSTLNATVTGNTIDQAGAGSPFAAVHVDVGALPSDTNHLCLDMGGPGTLANTLDGPLAFDDYFISENGNSRINLPGYAGPPSNSAQEVEAFLDGRNNVSGSNASNVFVNSNGITGTGTSCPAWRRHAITGQGTRGNATMLTDSEFTRVVDAAIARWVAAGLTSPQQAWLERATFQIVDRADGVLGNGSGAVAMIIVDRP